MNTKLFIKKSTSLLGLQVITTLFLVELAGTLASVGLLVMGANRLWDSAIIGGIIALHVVAFIALVVMELGITLNWASNTTYIHGHHLIVIHNLMDRVEKMYELTNLRTVHIKQTWLGKQFKYGDIHLTFSTAGLQFKVTLLGIHDPGSYERTFEMFMEQESGPTYAPLATAPM